MLHRTLLGLMLAALLVANGVHAAAAQSGAPPKADGPAASHTEQARDALMMEITCSRM